MSYISAKSGITNSGDIQCNLTVQIWVAWTETINGWTNVVKRLHQTYEFRSTKNVIHPIPPPPQGYLLPVSSRGNQWVTILLSETWLPNVCPAQYLLYQISKIEVESDIANKSHKQGEYVMYNLYTSHERYSSCRLWCVLYWRIDPSANKTTWSQHCDTPPDNIHNQ